MRVKAGFLFAVLGLCGARAAYAAPSISGYSGTLSNGQSVTLTGSSFGSRAPSYDVFDQVESGSLSGSWTSTNDLDVSNAAVQRSANSTYCAHLNFRSGFYGGYLTGGSDSPAWFVQYWYRIASNFDWGTTTFGGVNQFLANVKFLRFWSTTADTGNYYVSFGYPNLFDSSYWVDENFRDTTNYFGYTRSGVTKDAWHSVEAEFQDSSGSGIGDGLMNVWVDGTQYVSTSTLVTINVSNTHNKRPLIIGFFNAWGPNTGAGETDQAPNDFYMDDIVAANSRARVVLGDNAVFSGCTHREYQKPTAWSSTSATVTLNTGSFASNAAVYAFVVDSSGNASAGYALTLGQISTKYTITGGFTMKGGVTLK